MATILTVPEIIELGKVSKYLSANYTDKRALFGGAVIKTIPPVQIAFITDGLEWGYLGGAQTSASLRSTANYLYWLCGKFQLEAQVIINGPGGGSVVPTPSIVRPNPLDFIVSVSSPIVTGASTLNIPSFIGYNLQFDRGGQPQYTTNPGDGSNYYSWDRVTGAFSCFGAAQDGEQFRLTPV